ncbi:hypothetical protein SELR_02670 [Selenomonas ruminantium subsp. lactilytica TAM6421]|uniref:Lipoprotein n=1 Tax=Selenomonas ruminantium subsp. lactilytica (strain NBRC 103574 / TAM6421) TaxID=927704 RepID=I0GMI8_SELRL|nr:hypothetical protein SELR_02670 [Selenomonas ruminantium subsp. lactilytica TAM6421]
MYKYTEKIRGHLFLAFSTDIMFVIFLSCVNFVNPHIMG